MNKISFIKDPHLMFGFSNNIRKPFPEGGSWEKGILKKLEVIRDKMISEGSDILIFSGDLLDHSSLSDWSFNKYLKNKNVLIDIFINSGISLYSVQGNHDMFHGTAKIDGTVFGDLVNNNIITHLTKNPLTFQTTVGIINIYGNDYSFTKEAQKLKFSEINDIPEGINFLVSHTNISPKDDHLVDFTYSELSKHFPNIKAHLCGHYHLGYVPELVNKVAFINPWNMTRVSREYQVRLDNHTPELIIMDLDKYSDSNLDWVGVHVIPFIPFNEVFNEEVISILQESQKFKFFEDSEGSGFNLEDLTNDDLSDDQLLRAIINKVLSQKSSTEKQVLLEKAIQYLI